MHGHLIGLIFFECRAEIMKKAISSVKGISVKKKVARKINIDKSAVRGTRDVLPLEQPYRERVRRYLASVRQEFGFHRIDVPTIESENLFAYSVGVGGGNMMGKELYSFEASNGERIALRPECTPGVVRAYIEHKMHLLPKPIKLFSTGQVFRCDHSGGFPREQWQANFDIFGEPDPILDAQIFQIASRILVQLGIKNIEFHVNNIGTSAMRKEYQKILFRSLDTHRHKFCQSCKDFLMIDPFRVLDCQEDKCLQVTANAPRSAEYLDSESQMHFKTFLEYLDEIKIPYIVNSRLVRNSDYYVKNVFEIYSTGAEHGGRKVLIGGGGRYDDLVKSLGGEYTPAIGFGLDLDRLVSEMVRLGAKPYRDICPKVFLAQLGDLAKKKSLYVFSELQKNDILTVESFGRGNLRSQLRIANKMHAEVMLIIGQKEALDETVIVKNMVSGTQETVPRAQLVCAVKKILKNSAQPTRVHSKIKNM